MERRDRFLILSLVLLGFALSALWALRNPVYEAPDEPDHVALVNYVLTRGHLPIQETPEELLGEGHQHPLYYLLAAGALKAIGAKSFDIERLDPAPGTPYVVKPNFANNRDRLSAYFLRICGSLMLAAAVWLLALMSRRLITGAAWVIPPLMLATLPQVSFITGAINNDTPTLLCGVGAFSAITFAFMGEGSWLTAGIWCGVGFLVKKSLGVYCALGGLLVLFPQHRQNWWRFYLPMLGGVLPIVIRNWVLYHEPLATGMEERTLTPLVVKKGLDDPYWQVFFFPKLWRSSIGLFGWMNVYTTTSIYVLWTWLFVPSVLAFKEAKKPFVWLGFAVCFLIFAFLINYNLTYSQPQGRLLWPALGAFMILVGVGYSKLLAMTKAQPKMAIGVLGLTMVAVNFACLHMIDLYLR